MSVDYCVLGQRIKTRRRQLKMTQYNLAETLSVSVGYISQIERGVTKVSLDTLSAIASLLHCDLTELLQSTTPGQNNYLTPEFHNIFNCLDDEQKKLLLSIAQCLESFHR